MTFFFIALILGCIGLLVKVFLDYRSESPIWQAKVQQAEEERDQYISQVDAFLKAAEESSSQSKLMDEEIKLLEKLRDELRADIEKLKQEMAKKGRIIIHRQAGEFG